MAFPLRLQDMLDEAAAIQARSKQSTAHSRRMVEQAKAVGAAPAPRLHEQTDQLDRVRSFVFFFPSFFHMSCVVRGGLVCF